MCGMGVARGSNSTPSSRRAHLAPSNAGFSRFLGECVLSVTGSATKTIIVVPEKNAETKGDDVMRIFLALAIIISAAIGMAGCFYHHQQAVVTQPAPPLK
jgi:hypothetical protein